MLSCIAILLTVIILMPFSCIVTDLSTINAFEICEYKSILMRTSIGKQNKTLVQICTHNKSPVKNIYLCWKCFMQSPNIFRFKSTFLSFQNYFGTKLSKADTTVLPKSLSFHQGWSQDCLTGKPSIMTGGVGYPKPKHNGGHWS